MDPSQTEAVNRAFEILGEHFDHVVIAVGTYDEDKQYTTSASYTGESPQRLGSVVCMRRSGWTSICGVGAKTRRLNRQRDGSVLGRPF